MKFSEKIVTIATFPLVVAAGICGAIMLNVLSRHVAYELARRDTP